MVENKSSVFGIIAIIIGASGLGLGAFSIVNYQTIEGPQGLPGDDGQDGIDGVDGTDGIDGEDVPGGFIVRILDPNHGEAVSGNITIRGLIYGSEDYSLSILRNGTEIGTLVPLIWDTSTVSDGWWNLSIIATDVSPNNQSQDEVLIYTYNNLLNFYNYTIDWTNPGIGITQTLPDHTWGELHWINFNLDFKANIFVYFNCKLSLNAVGWAYLGFRLDDVDYIWLEYIFLDTTIIKFTLNGMYSQVEPGPHKVSFYWYVETGPTRTMTCEYLSMLGVVITL